MHKLGGDRRGDETILEEWSFASVASFMKTTEYDGVNDSVLSYFVVYDTTIYGRKSGAR
jgi:hypothetical protein